MAIGINYTHLEHGHQKILPNYIYALTNTSEVFRDVRYNQVNESWKRESLQQEITSGRLHGLLHDSTSRVLFDSDLVRQILLIAYPFEIEGKFLGIRKNFDQERAEMLIGLFNEAYSIDYRKELDAYKTTRGELPSILERCHKARGEVYESIDEAVAMYRLFVCRLLADQGYEREADALESFMKTKLNVTENKDISAVTLELGTHMEVQVGSHLYVVLFHELTHVVNNFFRYRYLPGTYELRERDRTKENEGFANLIGYHFIAPIRAETLNLGEVAEHAICYSPFIEAFVRLQETGSEEIATNKTIIEGAMREYDDRGWSAQKLEFYTERLYKYFPYHQHRYFYPKELLYHIGYTKVLQQYCRSDDKEAFLAECFLGKIVLVY